MVEYPRYFVALLYCKGVTFEVKWKIRQEGKNIRDIIRGLLPEEKVLLGNIQLRYSYS